MSHHVFMSDGINSLCPAASLCLPVSVCLVDFLQSYTTGAVGPLPAIRRLGFTALTCMSFVPEGEYDTFVTGVLEKLLMSFIR